MQPNAKTAKKACLFFSKTLKIIMQVNANLSKFEQSKHITVKDANIPYSNTLHPNRKKWLKT